MAQHQDQRVLRPAQHGRRRSRYVAALDGLRAVAVLAVIFYHMQMSWAPGGLMGVTVFFVISGYLINGLLVAEHDRTGTISLSQFWLRRVRRIIPAVLLAIAGTLVLCALLNPALFTKARADLLPSLFFYNNWWQIFHNVSYFEAAAAPSPFTHFWSLAIEEQFYIVWPILLLFLFKRKIPKKGIVAIVVVLAVLSGLEMALLYSPSADPSRVYYGTDTRAVSLLIGVLLAFIWPSTIFGNRRVQSKNPAARLAFNIVGVIALAGIIAVVVFSNSYTAFPYRGGIVLVSLLSAVLIAVLVVPGTWMARLLQTYPFVWIGKRSYSMYLWHYPIILATASFTTTVQIPWWVRLAQLVLIFAVSDLSYRFVEDPIRSGALGKWWRARRAAGRAGAYDAKAGEDAAVRTGGTASAKSEGKPTRRSVASRTNGESSMSAIVSRVTVAVCAALACAAIVALVVVEPVQPSMAPQSSQPSSAAASQVAASSSADSPAISDSSNAASASTSSSPSSSKGSSESEESKSTSSQPKSKSAESGMASSKSASSKSASASAKSKSASSESTSSKSASSKSEKSSSGASSASSKASKSATSELVESASSTSAASSTSQWSASVAKLGIPGAVAVAVEDKAAGLTKKQRAKAKKALRGPVGRMVDTIVDVMNESFREAEEQRRQEAYDKLFHKKHLNKAGGEIYNPVLIGDSVSAGAESEFYRVFPYGHCDALVNRNIWESPYGYYVDNKQAGSYVVFCLGTNNAATDEQIDELLSVVPEKKKIVMVNIRCPRDWEAQTNSAIARAFERYSNVVAVVDWYGASAGHDEYFYEDGIHLTGVGAEAYVALIQQAIMDSIE